MGRLSKTSIKNSKATIRSINKNIRYKNKIIEFGESKFIKIQKPKYSNEINLQVNIYNILKKLGLDVHLEVRHKIEGRSVAIFDLVIFNNIGDTIIEVKRKGQKITDKQIEKYSRFDAELMFCIGNSGMNVLLEQIKNKYFLIQ